jgi:SAM-dependent methyltransferase
MNPSADCPLHASLEPSPWVVRFAHLVAPGGRVLDLAAGGGRHARWFAAHGASVVAVDRDAAVLGAYAGLPGIETRVADLETGPWPFAGERFEAIVVVNYLHRPLWPHLRSALRPDGVLLYETFAMGNEAYGRPANPDFLLCQDELLSLAGLSPALRVVAFEQGRVECDDRRAVVQRLAAVGPQRDWPPVLSGSPGRSPG